MPYASVADLPESIRARLPPHALEIFRSVFNNAWETYADRTTAQREEVAHRVAWASVKRQYRKQGDDWIVR